MATFASIIRRQSTIMFLLHMFILPIVFCTKYNNDMISDYFDFKSAKCVSILHCNEYDSKILAENLTNKNIRVNLLNIHENNSLGDLEKKLNINWFTTIGYVLNFKCSKSKFILDTASQMNLFRSRHSWLIIIENLVTQENFNLIEDNFSNLNLSVDSDIAVSFQKGKTYKLIDVFNFGKIQGNSLEIATLGRWTKRTGLKVYLQGFKYYNRWDFHNLTLRGISVMLGKPIEAFKPEMLTDIDYTDGISAMTKITSLLLHVFMDVHNFRINYTIADRWVGSPERNSSLSVTNALLWKEQDISSTCLRMFSPWLEWMDPLFPSVTMLETKFYYRIPSKGVGDYENRFLQPLSPVVWWCCLAASGLCGLVLGFAAFFERRRRPVSYAFFSVTAAACQQDFDDGESLSDESFGGQGRRILLFVIGCSFMLLYNYYTSSVVSWLLNAAPPTIANLDGLINSDLELVFEDIGYTRSWLESPGFFYYKGFYWPKEDELREKKVKNAKRTVELLQNADDGIKLVLQGGFAYHTEPYNANRRISRSFDDAMLCELGVLQMMQPAQVYMMGQKHSPYRKFFVWSMIRALERGHMSYARRRISGEAPRCSGGMPRALPLGQASPAFALLVYGVLLSLMILILETISHRFGYGLFLENA